MKLILASNNDHKLAEFRGLADSLGLEIVSQKEAGCFFEVDENGTTFEENSYLKAIAVTRATGLPAIADDSGLVVDALNGEPGIYSARYGPGHEAPASARNEYLLNKMKDVPDGERTARFVCCICCTFPNGDVISARGECEGEILHAPVGEGGFGYDPVFHPFCVDVAFAELTAEQKNAISHRGNALRKFRPLLEEYIHGTDK